MLNVSKKILTDKKTGYGMRIIVSQKPFAIPPIPLQKNNNKYMASDDRGTITIPADNDTVIYKDDEGQYYEINIDELIEYDGDDHEITYNSKEKNYSKKMHSAYLFDAITKMNMIKKQNISNYMHNR